MQVDCTTIGENVETNYLFNVNMLQVIPNDPTYIYFNQFIAQSSGVNDVTTKRKNKVWFHHNRDILLPLIETRD